MQRNDGEAVTYGEGVVTFRDIDVTVFDGHAVDFGIGVFNDVPIRRGGITGKCFLPAIDDDAVRCGCADDGNYHAFSTGDGVGRVVFAVDAAQALKDVGSNAGFGAADGFGDFGSARATSADGVERDARVLKQVARLVDEGFGAFVTGIGHDALELEAGHGCNLLREFKRGFGRLYAAAIASGVAFDEDVDGGVVFFCTIGQSARGDFRIDGNGHGCAFAQFGEAFDFDGSDDIIGDEDVGDAGFNHDFGFAHFLADDANGPRSELHFGDFGDFMRFGVYAQGNVPFVARFLRFSNIFFEDIEVDGERGRVEVVYGHGNICS